VTRDEVYSTAGITSAEVGTDAVDLFIKSAEKHLDRYTLTTYWAISDDEEDAQTGTASDGDTSTLTDSSQSWSVNAYNKYYVWIHAGTGAGQVRKISSNTATELTVSSSWSTTPDSTSQYRIFYSASTPTVDDEIDGTGSSTFYTMQYPVQELESLSINDTTVTTSYVYKYKSEGKLKLGDSAEVSYFLNTKPQQVDITYHFGVYPIPEDAKRYCLITAALSTLASQMGGTYATPSTYSLPEGSLTIGQAYVNIRGTFDVLLKEAQILKQNLPRYMVWI